MEEQQDTLRKIIMFRATEQLAAALAEAASRQQITRSELIRETLRKLEVGNERKKK